MRSFGKWLGRTFILLFLAFGIIWLVAPEEPVDRVISFDPNILPDDLDSFLATSEAQFSDIIPGVAKRIVWAGAKGQKTPLSIVYLHGFSATSEEVRPVPDNVAKALGANLFFTRLTGHGRGSAAMAEARAGDWLEDTAEALAIGRRLGDRVLVIATSSGAPLAAIAATDPALSEGLAGLVLVSPNFGLANPVAKTLLDLPLARWWAPVLAGQTRSFTPQNADHGRYWTTSYPTTALFPMAAVVREARGLDYGAAKIPALILFSPKDQVIDASLIPAVAEAWGGDVQLEPLELGPQDDPYFHVILGDILSPGQTVPGVALITEWAAGL